MTLDGTNTWLLRSPGSTAALIVDPGPDDPGHLERIRAAVAAEQARASMILLTHGHRDHSAGAGSLARILGCPVRALDPRHRLGGEGLSPGDVITAGDLAVEVIGTPGHSHDSLTFRLVPDGALLTGDTILGRGSTVVAYPDGRLAEYLDSLVRLRDLAESGAAQLILPGHGPVLDQPLAVIEAYLAHREQRLEQVRQALADLAPAERHGEGTAHRIVETVYADVPRTLWPAAALSVLAQLDYLNGLDQTDSVGR